MVTREPRIGRKVPTLPTLLTASLDDSDSSDPGAPREEGVTSNRRGATSDGNRNATRRVAGDGRKPDPQGPGLAAQVRGALTGGTASLSILEPVVRRTRPVGRGRKGGRPRGSGFFILPTTLIGDVTRDMENKNTT